MKKFEVIGEGGLEADNPNTGIGIWLRFAKDGERASANGRL